MMNGQEPPRVIVFDESRLGDPQMLAAQLFDDESDPRSVHYRRHLNRPKIAWGRIAAALLLPAAALAGLAVGLAAAGVPPRAARGIAALCGAVYALVMARRAAITLVRVYQRYAPDSVRMQCRFEPSCSEYMIQSIEKYGLLRGAARGVGRLRRCNVRGGGFDPP